MLVFNYQYQAISELTDPSQELDQIQRPVAAELAEVEKQLTERLSGAPPPVKQAYRHTLKAGGKRLRPLLVLLAARSVGQIGPEVLRLAVAIEKIHIASMLHDDVVDRSLVRRGQASVQALWDNRIAVLTGDYIAADVYRLLADTQETAHLRIIAQAAVEMCEAEARELTLDNSQITEPEYLQIIRGKTAALIAAATKVGGCVGEGSPEQVSALDSYGHSLGMAFQIGDDLLDLYGHRSQIGKPVGRDLRSGLRTLPVIFACRQSGSEKLHKLLSELGPDGPEQKVKQAAELVAQLGGKAYAESKVSAFADQAAAAINTWPASPAYCSLVSLAEFMRHRAW